MHSFRPSTEIEPLEYARATRELTPLEIEDLVEGERRYKPEPSEDALQDTSATQSTARCRKRTVRMRVFNFRALPRPKVDEVCSTPRCVTTRDA